MDTDTFRKANDLSLVRKAITHHLHESDLCFSMGNYEESRRHRYIVQSLREQLRLAGVLDPTQSTRLQLRTIDMPDDMVRVNPNDLIRND
jgi:hypothetical protein